MSLSTTDQIAERLVRWPVFDDRDRESILRVFSSRQLINGAESRLLEQEWARFVGTRHCVAVSSCTHALHLALCALGIGIGDEVLVPALTFAGTVSPIIHCGATPVFVDALPGTYELDPLDAASKRTARTKAIIPVHVHGMPCDMARVARTLPDLQIVEDACQAHGAEVNGRRVGGLGVIGCFSLNQVKPLPAGQGGLVVTDSAPLAERIRALASQGAGDVIGWSYGITEFAAAIARSQLHRLADGNERGRSNARRFAMAMQGYERLLPTIPSDRVPVWHKFRVMLPAAVDQDTAVQFLRDHDVQVETWPGKVVPDLDGYKSQFVRARCPLARQIVAQSIIIGSEVHPFAAQHPEIIDKWAGVLRHLLERFHA